MFKACLSPQTITKHMAAASSKSRFRFTGVKSSSEYEVVIYAVMPGGYRTPAAVQYVKTLTLNEQRSINRERKRMRNEKVVQRLPKRTSLVATGTVTAATC